MPKITGERTADTTPLDELLKSQAERHTERANNIKRLLLIDSEACGDLGAELKAEAEREVRKAAALERLRRLQ